MLGRPDQAGVQGRDPDGQPEQLGHCAYTALATFVQMMGEDQGVRLPQEAARQHQPVHQVRLGADQGRGAGRDGGRDRLPARRGDHGRLGRADRGSLAVRGHRLRDRLDEHHQGRATWKARRSSTTSRCAPTSRASPRTPRPTRSVQQGCDAAARGAGLRLDQADRLRLAKYGSADERTRLLQKWEDEVNSCRIDGAGTRAGRRIAIPPAAAPLAGGRLGSGSPCSRGTAGRRHPGSPAWLTDGWAWDDYYAPGLFQGLWRQALAPAARRVPGVAVPGVGFGATGRTADDPARAGWAASRGGWRRVRDRAQGHPVPWLQPSSARRRCAVRHGVGCLLTATAFCSSSPRAGGSGLAKGDVFVAGSIGLVVASVAAFILYPTLQSSRARAAGQRRRAGAGRVRRQVRRPAHLEPRVRLRGRALRGRLGTRSCSLR